MNETNMNRAKFYQLALFPMNNGATNVYYVLILSYIATFGNAVLGIAMVFASMMVTGMRVFDAITDPIIGALMDKTDGKFGKFRPFMVIGNIIMAVSVVLLYIATPMIPDTMMWARYVCFVGLYAVWVIGYTFQTSVTRSAQSVRPGEDRPPDHRRVRGHQQGEEGCGHYLYGRLPVRSRDRWHRHGRWHDRRWRWRRRCACGTR